MDVEHLDENELAGYVGSGLSAEERARVEEHIDECSSCRRTLAAVACDPELGRPAIPDDDGAFELPDVGDQIAGRFTIVRALGRGGMGCVFEATDDDLGIQVALKVLRPELTRSEEQVRHLRREILAGRKVAHPNVCRIYDLGKTDRLHFITMELVAGDTLAERLRAGPLTRGDALDVLDQLLAAVATAHGERIVHRDLKPANLMFDAAGRLRVMDFGLARDLDGEHSLVGAIGTPAYWSPEQARGEPAGPPADVYAAGLLGSMLLAGAASPQRRVDHVPALYRPWVERCLRDDPADRYPDAHAARLALGELRARDTDDPATQPRVVRGAAISGDESTHPVAPPRRRRAAPIALALALAAAGTYAVWPRGSEPPVVAIEPPLPRTELRFEVEPAQARVELDGRDLGAAREAAVEPGPHAIAVTHDGFARWTSSVTVRAHEHLVVHVALTPGVAHVAVDSTPRGLPIELDGAPTAYRTPATFDATPGVHRVRVVDAHGKPWTQEFTARVDGVHSFHAAFVAVASRPRPVAVATIPPAERPPGEGPPVESPPVVPPSRTAIVAASAVTLIAGAMPTMVSGGPDLDLLVKMCIDERGAVTSAALIKASAAPPANLAQTLRAWRYKPYLNVAGHPTPVCFPLSLHVVVKPAD